MESEHTQFSSPQPESGASEAPDATYTAPVQNAQPEQDASMAETSQNEASSANRHRRRRSTRGGARHSRSGAAAQASEEPEPAEEAAETAGQHEPPQLGEEAAGTASQHEPPQLGAEPAQPSASATPDTSQAEQEWETATGSEVAPAEISGDLESTAPAGDLRQPEAETWTPLAASESVWGFQPWQTQPPGEWNPFMPQVPAAEPAFAPPAEPIEMTSDLAMASLSGPTAEAPVEANTEVIAPTPTQEAISEAPAAPEAAAPDQAGGETQETFRAPLSGVEVRPPRRYRFDRPSPTAQEAPPRETPQLTAQQEAPSSETPGAQAPGMPPKVGKGRSAPAPAGKEAGAAPSADKEVGAVIERELTETPEIEADVVAAEDLARATQAALEEEVAEALESFTTAAGPTPSTRSGRRRRRRPGSSAVAASGNGAEAAAKEQAPAPPAAAAQPSAPQPSFAPAPPEYQVTNGLQHIGQPQSPFGGPEPSSARGFGPVPRRIAMPAERSVRMPRPERTVETGNVSANQLAMIFTQAIQQQTDRLLMELRRSQGTPSMTVNFPPMPSNERIGVFVDVANLLYSARNMRIAIDFGRLLDFLRGNRRLVRAHAYCPTSPDPRAEQMFLDAVKGLGYRITTKNYKTFSSGAKKADLDLDLCMDIVRLVDAGAVDCISLVSGDSDFLPLLEYCSDHGVRVEVAAFDEATASILRQSCDLFINLSMVEEIRA